MEMTLGERIRKARKGKMTQSELAEAIGVHEITVRRWELGERTPDAEDLQKAANVLGVTVSDLIGDGGNAAKSLTENKQSERKQNIAVLTLENGRKIEAPATPEGYAFLKDLFAMSLSGQP